MQPPLEQMKAPGDYRPGIWRGRVLQIKLTNICDLACQNCSVGVGIARKLKKTFTMSTDDFRRACRSLKGFPGVIGVFGGNPCLAKNFDDICAIFREEIPNKEQRGLWSNRLFGHGAVCRETFNPLHSNLNVHQVQVAYDEIKRDWPEARPLLSGLNSPSRHGPIFGSMLDLGISEVEMWAKVGKCYVNQSWSAEITMVADQLVGYFCEIAATMAELTDDAGTGMAIAPGWWSKPMAAFEPQVQAYCTKCLVSMNPRKIDAAGNEAEEYTAAWAPVLATVKGRPMQQISAAAAIMGGEPATKYLDTAVIMPGKV